MELYCARRRTKIAAFCFFAAVVVLVRHRIFHFFSTGYLGGGGGDPGLYLWLMKSNQTDLFSLPWFNTRNLYPYSYTLAWSDSYLLPSLLTWPLVSLGVPLPAAHNTLMLLIMVLSGYFTFRLVFLLAGSFAAALFGGLVFGSNAYIASQMSHIQLNYTFFIPLAFICLIHFLSSAKPRWAAAFVAVLFSAFLTTVYYAVFIALSAAIFSVFYLAVNRRYLDRRMLFALIPAVILAAVLFPPFVYPYLKVKNAFSARPLEKVFVRSARTESFVSASGMNLVYGGSRILGRAKVSLFCGFVLLISFAAALLFTLRKQGAAYLIVCGVAILLSLYINGTRAPPLWAYAFSSWMLIAVLLSCAIQAGRKSCIQPDLFLPFLALAGLSFLVACGPHYAEAWTDIPYSFYTFLYRFVPGVDSLRAVCRYGVVVIFGMAVLSSLWLAQIERRIKKGPVFIVLLALIAFAENLVPATPVGRVPRMPPVLQQLKQDSKVDDAFVMLPIFPDGSHRTKRSMGEAVKNMHRAFAADRLFINGYSGQGSNLQRSLGYATKEFPDAASVRSLQTVANVKYAVYRSPGNFVEKDVLERQSQVPGLTFLEKDSLGYYLFRLEGSLDFNSSVSVFVPARRAGTVSFNLKSLDWEDGSLPITITDKKGGHISTLTLEKDGDWHSFSIPRPALYRVRPEELIIRLPHGRSAALKDVRFSVN